MTTSPAPASPGEPSLDDFGSAVRSAGHQLADQLTLPIAVTEASTIRWRWGLRDESSHGAYFSASFQLADGGAVPGGTVELLAAQQLTSHASESVRVQGPGTLELRWATPSTHEGWWLASSEPVTLEYEVRVLPTHELTRRARDMKLAALRKLATEERQRADALREQNQAYESALDELLAQIGTMRVHIADQEALAAEADEKAAAYNRERQHLLEQAMADVHQELADLGPCCAESTLPGIVEE